MSMNALPPVTNQTDWEAALRSLREKEKAHTRAQDSLAAARRRLPVVPVTGEYRFSGPEGDLDLPGLFGGAHQLIVYHHMLKPDDPAPCPGCSMWVDNVGHLSHLNQRDTRLVLVSRAPLAQIQAFRDRMGWDVPWYHSGDSFNSDVGVTTGFGLNVFIRDDTRVYRSYFTTDRGVEAVGTLWSLLDLTPYGRQELWEDSPAGWPQTPPFTWWRLHDSY